jgi:DNA-binding beta-propeller fold protein YncE
MDGPLVNVCDTFNYRIQRYTVSASGVPSFSGLLGGTRPAQGGFNGAFAVDIGPDGTIYAVDWFNHRIQTFDSSGNFVSEFGGYSSKPGSLIFPRDVLVSADGSKLIVTDSENNRIDVFTTAGVFVQSVKPPTGSTPLLRPHQTAVAADGTYWIADTLNNRIVHLATNGTVLHSWNNGGNIKSPQGIALDADGNVYVSNTTKSKVEKYDQNGTLLDTLATPGGGVTNVRKPAGLRIAGDGADARIWIADLDNDRVLILELDGDADTSFGTFGSGDGQFSMTRDIALGPNRTAAVADFANNRISLWTY